MTEASGLSRPIVEKAKDYLEWAGLGSWEPGSRKSIPQSHEQTSRGLDRGYYKSRWVNEDGLEQNLAAFRSNTKTTT